MNKRSLFPIWKFVWRRRYSFIATMILTICYLVFFNHVDQYEVGIARNAITGDLWLQRSGFHITAPWTRASAIDMRPQRVCVTSSTRALNCKLVQFNSNEFRQFVATEGFRYYWWSNRISFNMGYPEEYRGMKDILRGYAYSLEPYPFVQTTKSEP